MRIHCFSSTQFRNLEHEDIVFSPGVNLLIGENGHGKTNILEALFFFKFGRSFRTQRDADLIRFEAPFCRSEVKVEYSNGGRISLAASIERNGAKRIKVDGDEVGRYSKLVGRYPSVLFGPQDLGLVSGFPAERRRFIDMTGSMTDQGYLDGLRAYRRVLVQRNAALKAGNSRRALRAWDDELIRTGCQLLENRVRVVHALRGHMRGHIEAMSVPYSIEMSYESELLGNHPDDVTNEEHFSAQLSAVAAEESRRRTTLVGPHRDDVRIQAAGRDLRRYGSQGQRRLMAVLLRLSELSFLEAELSEPCVLLLDDLFSELDDDVSARLKRILDGTHQIFVTSPVPLEWHGALASCSYRVANGMVGLSTDSN